MRKAIFVFAAVFTMLISTTIWANISQDSYEKICLFDKENWPTVVEATQGDMNGDDENDLKERLTHEVGRYLLNVNAPKDVSAEHIVDYCLRQDFNIAFLLAQGTLETGMGRLGIGKTKKSMFGVISRRFETRNLSVNHYVDLIQKKYLRPGQDETDLLNKFTTRNGTRYARNPRYEIELRSMYNSILQQYDIYEIQYQENS